MMNRSFLNLLKTTSITRGYFVYIYKPICFDPAASLRIMSVPSSRRQVTIGSGYPLALKKTSLSLIFFQFPDKLVYLIFKCCILNNVYYTYFIIIRFFDRLPYLKMVKCNHSLPAGQGDRKCHCLSHFFLCDLRPSYSACLMWGF